MIQSFDEAVVPALIKLLVGGLAVLIVWSIDRVDMAIHCELTPPPIAVARSLDH